MECQEKKNEHIIHENKWGNTKAVVSRGNFIAISVFLIRKEGTK